MDREAEESRWKRFLVLLGVALLLGLPAQAVSCSSSPYADDYYLQVGLQESGGEWSQRQVAVAVLLCDDREDFRAPELKTKADIERWFSYDRERYQERFTRNRMEYIQVATNDPKKKHALQLSGEALGEQALNAKLFVVANLESQRNPEDHSASVLLSKDIEAYVIELTPGRVAIRAAAADEIAK